MSDGKGLKESAKEQAKAQGKATAKKIKGLIKSLTPEQRDQLLRRLTEEKPVGPVVRADADDVPLSFAQEREWFRDRLFPDVAHNISGALRLEGTLSIEALQATFDAVIARHETLRSTIAEVQGRPVQTVRAPMALPIRVVEASDWRALYAEEMTRGFDLATDLLLRATLIRLAEREHVLLVTMHHIASDGWSIGVLMAEIAELYTAFVQQRPSALSPLPIQYGDFARWQQERNLENGLAYWREQLADVPPVLELQPDLATSAGARDHDAGSVSSQVGGSLKQSLEALSRDNGTTLFVTLLTAFMALLMRRTGSEDIVIGSPVSGRSRVECEPLIGLFLNTLALRAKLSPDLSFREAMTTVRQTVLDALAHADVPIERVVQDLDIRRTSGVHPLYETIFNFTPSAPRRLDLPGLRVTLEDAPAMIEEFSTQLFITDFDGSLSLDLRYRGRRYSEGLMASFLDQYVRLLEQAAAGSERPIGSFDLTTALSPDPAKRLEKPRYPTVVEGIANWIERAPDAPAVSQGDAVWTYAEFGAAMDAVAGSLRSRGLHLGDVVAVFGERSPSLIAALAGVFASGGVLLTLSPDLPEQRRQVMLDEAGARFLISDGDIGELPGAPADPRADDAAYVFFTSGSTGTPKAILGTHQGLAHWLQWQRETFAVGPGDRSGQLTGLSFDVVLRDVFLPLTSGATLVLPDDDTLGWLERERITTIHTVPAVAETWLLNRRDDVTLRSLRRVFFAGEPLTDVLINRWREAFPQAGEIINLYGPTETTLAKCFYRVPAHPRAGIQPLGEPIPHTQVLVLTPERALCGVGEPGEIAIRTPFRSLGYLNAADENAKRFVRNPFTGDEDDVLYLTGDRGAYGADGRLEFRGRIDHQVKIRGVRVEPMEVAATLQAHPDVAACAVIARAAGPESGEQMLVAYVVLKQGVNGSAGALQQHLAQRLPAAMVPSAVVFLDALPLTANQKLDREKLPAPAGERPALESRYVAPRDAIELRLVQIWEELLRVRPVGVTDRFFEIGGHSLLALRLLVEVEQRLGRKVPLQALFEEPTIEHMAAVLRRDSGEWPLMVTLRPGEQRIKLFLVHPGGGTLLNYVHLVRHLPAELPVYGIQARGLDGTGEPHDVLEQMAADYIAAIRSAQPEGPYLLVGHSLGGVIAFEIARQLGNENERVAFLGLFDSVAPLSSGEHTVSDGRREDALRLATMAETIGRFLGERVDVSIDELSNLGTDEQIEHVVDALRRSRAVPPGEEEKLVRNLLKVSKAHIRAHRAYQPEIVPVPITLYRAGEAQPADYPSARIELLQKETLGWDSLTTEPVRVVRTSGNHVTMLSSAHAEELANLLCLSVSEALAAERARAALSSRA